MYLLVTSRLFQEDSTRFDNKFQETTVKLPTETYSVSVIDIYDTTTGTGTNLCSFARSVCASGPLSPPNPREHAQNV